MVFHLAEVFLKVFAFFKVHHGLVVVLLLPLLDAAVHVSHHLLRHDGVQVRHVVRFLQHSAPRRLVSAILGAYTDVKVKLNIKNRTFIVKQSSQVRHKWDPS